MQLFTFDFCQLSHGPLPDKSQCRGPAALLLGEPNLPHSHLHPDMSSALPILGKSQGTAGWKCVLCVIRSRTFNYLSIKNGFCKAIPEGICCIHFVHCFEDRNVITVTSPLWTVEQEKRGWGQKEATWSVIVTDSSRLSTAARLITDLTKIYIY